MSSFEKSLNVTLVVNYVNKMNQDSVFINTLDILLQPDSLNI